MLLVIICILLNRYDIIGYDSYNACNSEIDIRIHKQALASKAEERFGRLITNYFQINLR